MAYAVQRSMRRISRLWITEALLVAAILVFGGFVLLADARITPSELASGVTQVLSH